MSTIMNQLAYLQGRERKFLREHVLLLVLAELREMQRGRVIPTDVNGIHDAW